MPEMVIVSDYAGERLGRAIAQKIGCKYVDTRVDDFSDGEEDIKVKDEVRGRDAFFICPYQPDPRRRSHEIMLINSVIADSAYRVIDVPTYLGYMKKDWKDEARVPISIREEAKIIEQYADRVLTMSMHSPQIQGIFRIPLDHLDVSVIFTPHVKRYIDTSNLVVASPDIGGAKRAQILAEGVGTHNLAIVYKLRDPLTKEVTSKGVMGDVDGKDVLFIDDQAVTCQSLVAAAEEVKGKGAKRVLAYCCHPVLSEKDGIPAWKRIQDSEIERLYVTDTIPTLPTVPDGCESIEVVSSLPLFSEAIARLNANRSLSALFDQAFFDPNVF